MNKAILGLEKQNASIYASLIAKNIQFERFVIKEEITEEEHMTLLKEENAKLKELVVANKPPPPIPQPKEEKIQVKKDNKPKEEKDNMDDEDEKYEEPVKKFDIITNMEESKRAFFNGDYMVFNEMIKAYPFKFYRVQYKYNTDKDNAPDFSAKNLLKGFVRNFDDYRKYFMICFRCWKHQNKLEYKYNSLWIVNTNEPIQNIIGSTYDDFEFEHVESDDVEQFILDVKKLPENNELLLENNYLCIGESYVH